MIRCKLINLAVKKKDNSALKFLISKYMLIRNKTIIVADENIEMLHEAFSGFGEIIAMPGREITPEIIRDADVLLIRSVTKADAALLEGSSVKFIGTATIGTDHVDTEYLAKRGIVFTDAKGCNADAVAQYFITLYSKYIVENDRPSDLITGIIGAGNIGSRIKNFLEVFDKKYILNDPPLMEAGTTDFKFSSLKDALSADIVTFHTPLVTSGAHPTLRLLNEHNIKYLKTGSYIINSSRGEVAENKALLDAMTIFDSVISADVWEGEPDINIPLLGKSFTATPHVAGYSLEGKINGTRILHEKLARFLKTDPYFTPRLPKVENHLIEINSTLPTEEILYRITRHIYDIDADTARMKKLKFLAKEKRAGYFDDLRKNYRLRREFSNYNIKLTPYNSSLTDRLRALGFKVY